MTAPTSIVEFLNARLAEDEDVAASNAIQQWPGQTLRELGDYDEQSYALQPHDFSPQRRAHVLRFGPARVLRDVDAKRLILGLHVLNDEGVYDADGTERPGRECVTCFAEDWPCLTLRLLTLEFQDHKDYRTEWTQ